MIKLVVAGAAGRMGKAILRLAIEDKALRITGALEHPQSASLGADIGELVGCGRLGVEVSEDPLAVLKKAHVLIDFTHPSATTRHLQAAVKSR
ncbi:MAG TPA: 4-hydroxy-tetrahydrodipicolinate reductase, partial [bacterium]|nr:4-hydroxy-tetrahydrodipicolinate reductase [bacterium]